MCENENETSDKTWLGTSMSEMCQSQDPWHFSSTPIAPSKYHQVLYELPVSLKEPPQPHYNASPKHWDDDYVRMPYSPESLFVVNQGEDEIVKPRWEVICEALLKPINSVQDLEKAIFSYNSRLPRFTALEKFFTEVLEEEESQHFFTNLLPNIIQLVLQLPDIIPGGIPLLKRHHCKSISLSQLQVACLMANAFLCTFIWRKEMAETYPGINFIRLFTADKRVKRLNCVSEKFKCILHYFKRVILKPPVGVITFERKFIPRSGMPRWDTLDHNLGNTKIHITSSGTIEDCLGFVQVDFANKFVGGGVIGYGCVQEEIRFIICPELIISRLFTEELTDGEALLVTGVERYSNYSGYGDTFKWEGNVCDETPFDNYARRRTTVVVIDATRFTKPKDQFHCSKILRELNKAYVGFSSKEKHNLAPVATGNWGCGAFRGDVYLKSLIQLMACSAAGRDLVYYSFGNTEFRDEFYNMYLFLANNKVTVCQLWRYLCRFCAANLPQDKLFSFLQQCHFDMKSQPTLKQFLCFSTQKRKSDSSTSSNDDDNNDDMKIEKTAPSLKIPKTGDEVQSSTSKDLQDKNEGAERTSDNVAKAPISSEEIINVFKMLDGTFDKPKCSSSEEPASLLSHIHNMQKEPVRKSESLNDAQEAGLSGDVTVVQMEVDTVEEMPRPKTGFMEDKKRRITDYFSKMTNHVNNYL